MIRLDQNSFIRKKEVQNKQFTRIQLISALNVYSIISSRLHVNTRRPHWQQARICEATLKNKYTVTSEVGEKRKAVKTSVVRKRLYKLKRGDTLQDRIGQDTTREQQDTKQGTNQTRRQGDEA